MRYILSLFILSSFTWADYFGIEFPKKGMGEAYYKVNSIPERKKLFMDTLHPLIHQACENILADRKWVKNYMTVKPLIGSQDYYENKLAFIDKKYRIKKDKSLSNYMKRIDIINEALVLSQAAVESAWGTSRFTKVANNLFGEWTWGKRGIIPAGRPEGKKYKIRIFDTLLDSVEAYMLNLNRHHSYANYREARYKKHQAGLTFSGSESAEYLQAYSGIGDEYGKMLKGVISYNKMCSYRFKDELSDLNDIKDVSAGGEK
jgi:Bax protein